VKDDINTTDNNKVDIVPPDIQGEPRGIIPDRDEHGRWKKGTVAPYIQKPGFMVTKNRISLAIISTFDPVKDVKTIRRLLNNPKTFLKAMQLILAVMAIKNGSPSGDATNIHIFGDVTLQQIKEMPSNERVKFITSKLTTINKQ